MAGDGNECKDSKGDIDDDGLPNFAVIGDCRDTNRTDEVEDMIDDYIGHDIGGEEAVANEDEGRAHPSENVE